MFFLVQGCSGNKEAEVPAGSTTSSGDDPFYSFQWHLKNTGQLGGTSGEDINVESVWESGNRGEGILVAVVDDGVEITHADLKENVKEGMSFNFSDFSSNPGGTTATHGTNVTGLIAARDLNGRGVRGVAPRSSFLGHNLLNGSNTTLSNIQTALTRNISSVSVSNNSWGFQDGTGHFYPPFSTWKTGIATGLSSGRGGKGAIYVWAGGNGGTLGIDNSNFDGLANYFGVIAVCAVGDDGVRATYSEKGANLWVCAPSQGSSGRGIATTDYPGGVYGQNRTTSSTDLADKDYTKRFNGTSASTPIVAGVTALMVKANPDLGWRDVKIILARTARKNDAQSTGWTLNGANLPVHHSYGFGMVNATRAVNMAKTWANVGAQVTKTYNSGVPGVISDGQTNLTDTLSVSGSGISQIEFVEVKLLMDHLDWGELKIVLKRTGTYTTESELSYFHPCLNSNFSTIVNCSVQAQESGIPTNEWTFGSARHLDEPADGDWQLVVSEESGGTAGGTWNGWSLKFYGR